MKRSHPSHDLPAEKRHAGTTISLPGGLELCCASAEDRGIRKTMEDAKLVCLRLSKVHAIPAANDCSVLAVFDGHGGAKTANFLQETFLEVWAAQMGEPFEFGDDAAVRRAFRTTFEQLDTRFCEENPGAKSGSTVVVAVLPLAIKVPMAFVASAGDSGCYLLRRSALGSTAMDIHAVPLSVIHKPWLPPSEKDRIISFGGTVEAGRLNGQLAVSRSIGDLPFKKFGLSCRPSVRKVQLTSDDIGIAVGCDGAWSTWSPQDAASKIALLASHQGKGNLDVRRLCKNVVDHVVVDKRAADNVTLVLAMFTSDDS
ncbi:MAG: hypothetical protein KVP17_003843 [Porospora cf. gigantea B]|uniref:uncharacterized protein n=2 Tax=Porospora cf. gigantea B TaxID=2853592 RepID=UPI003571831F|nr:MAG: hypothetical protein KVP17_003843 [Porospora cf. gigantea B]